jgi:hypothetical protein
MLVFQFIISLFILVYGSESDHVVANVTLTALEQIHAEDGQGKGQGCLANIDTEKSVNSLLAPGFAASDSSKTSMAESRKEKDGTPTACTLGSGVKTPAL